MDKKVFERKEKGDSPILAICYDFDKTLSPDDMQAQGYIQSVNCDVTDFWRRSNELAEENDMDQNLAYMYLMVEEAEGILSVNRKNLESYGAQVKLFPGVEDWFERIRAYGKQRGVIVEHYIISSGLKEMIEGTLPAKHGAFEKIYASSFYFNKKGAAKWPAQVVNFTNKTQFLFRIQKGVLDVNDPGVNDSFAPEELRVPFRNMVYIGDSDTDIPCMRLVNSNGGYSIGVFNADTGDRAKVHKMLRDGRIKYFVPADYTENSELDALVKKIVDRTAANEELEREFVRCKRETAEADRKNSDEGRRKQALIDELGNSYSFASTHTTVQRMRSVEEWNEAERRELTRIAHANTQVYYVLHDPDIRSFFGKIIQNLPPDDDDVRAVAEAIRGKK